MNVVGSHKGISSSLGMYEQERCDTEVPQTGHGQKDTFVRKSKCSVIVSIMFKSCHQHCKTTKKQKEVINAKGNGGNGVRRGPRGPVML